MFSIFFLNSANQENLSQEKAFSAWEFFFSLIYYYVNLCIKSYNQPSNLEYLK